MRRIVLIGGTLVCAIAVGTDALTTPSLCLRGVPMRALPSGPMIVGDTLQLRAGGLDILGECDNAAPKSVRWSSSDSTVVHVDHTGRLVARQRGAAEIRVRARWSAASHSVVVQERRP